MMMMNDEVRGMTLCMYVQLLPQAGNGKVKAGLDVRVDVLHDVGRSAEGCAEAQRVPFKHQTEN